MPEDRIFGVIICLFGIFIVFAWVPIDVTSGIVERIRGRNSIGDSFAPTVAGVLLTLSGFWLAMSAKDEKRLTARNLTWVLVMIGMLAASLTVMRWLGPVTTWVLGEESYRILRDALPWKYIGFVTGGALLVFGLISLIERKLSLSRLIIGIGVALAIALLYDLPFDDVLLPPNGDV